MIRSALSLFSILLALFTFGCRAAPDPDRSDAPPAPPTAEDAVPEGLDPLLMERFLRASTSGFVEPGRFVVTDAEEWQPVWRRANTQYHDASAAPPVDFAERMVLVAALGEQTTGGSFVQIERVGTAGDTLHVVVREGGPAGGCPGTANMEQPVDLVGVPRSDLPVKWTTVYEYHACE